MGAPYAVKCDECRNTIRYTDSVSESAAGGYCDECRAKLDAIYPERVTNRMPGFDIHENGQLRLAASGEQTTLLPLPDSLIPASDSPTVTSENLETTASAVVSSEITYRLTFRGNWAGYTVFVNGLPLVSYPDERDARETSEHLSETGSTTGLRAFTVSYPDPGVIRHMRNWNRV